MVKMLVKRGDIFWVDLELKEGSRLQGGKRPAVVISNENNNKFSDTVNIVLLTSRLKKTELPTHVVVRGYGLSKPSMALGEQMRSIDKSMLKQSNWIGRMDKEEADKIRDAVILQIS